MQKRTALSNPKSMRGTAVYTAGARDRFEPIVKYLESLGLEHANSLNALVRHLDNDQHSGAIVFYENPVISLATRMEQREPLAACLEDWVTATETLIALFRRNRRRLALLDGHSALANGAIACQLLHKLPGVRANGEPMEAWTGCPSKGGALHLLADVALRRHQSAGALLSELEASSQPLGPAWAPDVEGIMGEQQRVAAAQQSTDTQGDAQAGANELLLLQLHQVQEELERHYLINRELEQQLKDAAARPDPGELDTLRTELQTRQARLANVKAQLTSSRVELKQARAHIQRLSEQLSSSEQNIQTLHDSLSWKFTGPIRKLLGPFMGRTDT